MEFQEKDLIEIDGSHGEGGGQILRTALAFSALLRKPIRVSRIRAARKKPGLQPQHLEAVEALVRITEARTEGSKLGSQEITFFPKKIRSGDYQFGVKTAGSITLLLQAILLPLCAAEKTSRVILTGGTHVPWSPPFHYLSEVLLPTLRLFGLSSEVTLEKWGFYPRGGGEIQLRINPVHKFRAVSLIDRGPLKRIRGLSAISNLPGHVAERQKAQALNRIREELGVESEVRTLRDVPSNGTGSFLFLLAEFEGVLAGFSSLGARGKPAEKVADEAVDSLKDYMMSKGCLDPHLADQLVPFMALTHGNSLFTTTRITEHLLTNLWVVQHFLKVRISVEKEKGEGGRIDFINEG
jgi:RNA 3'-phosphate cyclase